MNTFYKYNSLINFYDKESPIKNISSRNSPNNKLSFKSLKCNTCKSLNDVECFLCNFSTFLKYIKLYNLLK